MFNSIEGVDFIIDYYAVLDIPRDSSKKDIKKAIRKNRAQWHPDKMIKLSPEIREQAKGKNELFGKGEDVLLDTNFKPLYDERLEGFEEGLVSKDGIAIISLMGKRVGLDYLLSGKITDDSSLIAKAKELSRYNEESVESLKKLYELDSKNTAIKQLYKKELNSKINYISLLEGLAWSRAGIENQESISGLLCYAKDYLDKVEETIESVKREDIPAGLENRLLAHETGVTPLLTSDGHEATQSKGISTTVRERIIDNFTNRCEGIRDIAKKKQEVIEELLTLTDYEYLKRSNPPTDRLDIYISKGEEIMYGFKVDIHENKLTGTENPLSGRPVQELKEMDWNNDLILVRSNLEIGEFMAEVLYVTGKHSDTKIKE